MTADRPATEPRRIAVTVIGTSLVMDYGTEEAAREAMDAMAEAAQGAAPRAEGPTSERLRQILDEHHAASPYHEQDTNACGAECDDDLTTRLGAAPRAEGPPVDDLALKVAAEFQNHQPNPSGRCDCGWIGDLSPATNHHEHLMLRVLHAIGVTDDD